MATVDLSQLPKPQIIEELDFEILLPDVKAMMVAAFPEDQRAAVTAALELESEPLNAIAQVIAYREMLLRQRINDATAACMLSHSTGTNLDNLAANQDVIRLVSKPATDTDEAETESDSSFRLRAQAAYEGLSVAGPVSAYEFFAKSASGQVADAKGISPSPAVAIVSILSTEGDGAASPELLATVNTALSAEDKRPVADRLTVQSADIVRYHIDAELYLYPGPEAEIVQTAALNSLSEYLKAQRRIGRDVARSAIMAALHVEGVQRVELLAPAVNIPVNDTQAAYCDSSVIEMRGTDE